LVIIFSIRLAGLDMVRILDDKQFREYIRIPNSQKTTVNDKHIN
jgi:hypothetical protein